VVNAIYISVNRMARWLDGNVEKYAEGVRVNFRGRDAKGGGSPWDLFPWPQYSYISVVQY
jgi:hypothetical protein